MQGNATAQYNLGLLYQNGSGVPRDLRKASHWFRKAAEKGEPGAEAQLQEVLKALQGGAENQGAD
jgi:TPR repeat protein